MPRVNVPQDVLIDIVNEYFEWNNLPLQWNNKGVCWGLAHVRAKYLIEGRVEQFDNLIKKMAELGSLTQKELRSLGPDNEYEDFLAEIICVFDPENYDNQYHQNDSYRCLNVIVGADKEAGVEEHVEKVQRHYQLSMATSVENWVKIIRDDINMQVGEAFVVSSCNHAVQVHRLNGEHKYAIYDPNNPDGTIEVDGEERLMKFLSRECFPAMDKDQKMSKSDPIGLQFCGLSKESKKPVSRKPAKEIHQQYVKNISEDTSDTAKINSFGEVRLAYSMACEMDDVDYAEYYASRLSNEGRWLPKLETLREQAMSLSVETFNVYHRKVQDALVNKNDDNIKMMNLSSQKGKTRIFLHLVNHEKYKNDYVSLLKNKEKSKTLLKNAVVGGQEDILKKVIADIKEYQNDFNFREVFFEEFNFKDVGLEGKGKGDLFQVAIECDQAGSIEILLNEIRKEKLQMSQDKMVAYLDAAIAKNNIFAVETLIDAIPDERRRELFSAIDIPAPKAMKTNVHILNLLKKNGAELNDITQIIMQHKLTRRSNLFSFMRINLACLTDMIIEKISFSPAKKMVSSTSTNEFYLKEKATISNIPFLFVDENKVTNGKLTFPTHFLIQQPTKLCVFIIRQESNGKDYMVFCKPEEVETFKIHYPSDKYKIDAMGEIIIDQTGSITSLSGISNNEAKLFRILNLWALLKGMGFDCSKTNLLTQKNPSDIGYKGGSEKINDTYKTNAEEFLTYLTQEIKKDIQKQTSDFLSKLPQLIQDFEKLTDGATSLLINEKDLDTAKNIIEKMKLLQSDLNSNYSSEKLEEYVDRLEKNAKELHPTLQQNNSESRSLREHISNLKKFKERFENIFKDNHEPPSSKNTP